MVLFSERSSVDPDGRLVIAGLVTIGIASAQAAMLHPFILGGLIDFYGLSSAQAGGFLVAHFESLTAFFSTFHTASSASRLRA